MIAYREMSKYKELKKIYYKDKDAYENEYRERFNSSDTMIFDFLVGDYQAFLVENTGLLSIVTEIQEYNSNILKRMYSKNRLPSKALEQFRRTCLVDEVVFSNQIEGVSSTRKDINSIIENKGGAKKKRFDSIVKKYSLLSDEVRIPLNDSKDLRSLYNEILLDEVIDENPDNKPDGEIFRKETVAVQGRISGETIHRGVYPESKIIESINQACSILNDEDINVYYRISIFHYMFGYIHPFYDGNGRISRFISSYMLSRASNELAGYVLSKAIAENIDKYYKAFKKVNDPKNRGDLTPFVFDFLEIIRDAFENLDNELRYRRTEFNIYTIMLSSQTEGMDQKLRDLYYLLMQASLFSEMGISMEELTSFFEVSRVTMASRLKKIDDEGMLIVNTSGHYKYYLLNLEKFKSNRMRDEESR